MALVVINFADIIFAVDSLPAIFLITTDAFIVNTADIMAILGLRAMYFALAASVHRYHNLKYALALVLVFIGLKGFHSYFLDKFNPYLLLEIIIGIIASGIFYSLWKTKAMLRSPSTRHDVRLRPATDNPRTRHILRADRLLPFPNKHGTRAHSRKLK